LFRRRDRPALRALRAQTASPDRLGAANGLKIVWELSRKQAIE